MKRHRSHLPIVLALASVLCLTSATLSAEPSGLAQKRPAYTPELSPLLECIEACGTTECIRDCISQSIERNELDVGPWRVISTVEGPEVLHAKLQHVPSGAMVYVPFLTFLMAQDTLSEIHASYGGAVDVHLQLLADCTELSDTISLYGALTFAAGDETEYVYFHGGDCFDQYRDHLVLCQADHCWWEDDELECGPGYDPCVDLAQDEYYECREESSAEM